jgi:hypothetical protein
MLQDSEVQTMKADGGLFHRRQALADFKAFDKVMKRRGGSKPRAGDEMPS